MRNLAEELPSDSARKSGNVYLFKTAEATRSTPTQSSIQPIQLDTKSEHLATQGPQQASAWPTLSSSTIERLIYRVGTISPSNEYIAKSDDAIPSFFSRAESTEREKRNQPLTDSAVEAVTASIFAARTGMIKARQRTLALYHQHTDALFTGAGIVMGIAILGTDLGSNVSRATERSIPDTTQVELATKAEQYLQPTARPPLEAVSVKTAAIPSLGSTIVEHKPAFTISSTADIKEVLSSNRPNENGQALVAQLKGPNTTLQTISIAEVTNLQGPADRLDVIKAVEAPDASSRSNTDESVVTTIVTAKTVAKEKSSVAQKIQQKSAAFQKALVKQPNVEFVPRARVAKRVQAAVAQVKQKASSIAMRATHPIARLGAGSIHLARKKNARVAKPVASSQSTSPFVAVRTLDEAMALQFGAK